jgi:hypothetical protein
MLPPQRAVLNCIDYLSKFGYTREQVPTFPGEILMKEILMKCSRSVRRVALGSESPLEKISRDSGLLQA